MPASFRPEQIPTEAGVYRFYDKEDRVLYVGKAKNLKNRLNSYFQSNLPDRTERMVSESARVDWTVVSGEVEALQLEYTWIKQFKPPFNVRFRDDKSYPYLALALNDKVSSITGHTYRRGHYELHMTPYLKFFQCVVVRLAISNVPKPPNVSAF
jgi:excinuclease ABC subunit C